MSKLADKIRRTSRLEAQQLGFVTARATKNATLVLVGRASDARDAAELTQKGADVVVIGNPADGELDVKSIGCESVGAWITGGITATQLKERGFDFVVFDPDETPSTAVLADDIGYVMHLPEGVDDTTLRTIESFQLDAISVGTVESALTVRKQIELRRIFGLTRKPLAAAVAADISVEELQALRDTNVAVITCEGAANVERLRATIDALPPRSRRKDDERPTPLVPRSTAAAGEDDDDDDGEHEHEHS